MSSHERNSKTMIQFCYKFKTLFTVNPLLSPRGAYFFEALLRGGGLIETGGGLFTARGHHIYKQVWKPVVGEKLTCKQDTREETKLYDEFSVDIYRLSISSSQDQELVEHFSIELSRLLCKLLSREGCSLEFSPTRARFLEDGLVFPGRFTAFF